MTTRTSTSDRRVAVITGSSSGIGAATALRLAKRHWCAVINYSKSASQAEQVAKRCVDAGGEAIVVQADVSRDADCRSLAQAAVTQWGRIDALVNNAGVTKIVPHVNLDGLTSDDFLKIYSINVVAAFQMVRACAPSLRQCGRGAVVNVSSMAAFLGTGSSKAALNSLTLSLARVLGPEIRVNAVLPGYVDTPWVRRGYSEDERAAGADRSRELSPLKRVSDPDDIADAITWLIEGARSVTGEIMFIEDGLRLAPPRR
jgi:3-oxoacyl-[acyl-carrier protein] reductase